MHDVLLKAALTILAAYGADIPPPSAPVLRDSPRHEATIAKSSEFAMRVIAPPPCIDIEMVIVPPPTGSTPILGRELEAAEAWRNEVARCRVAETGMRLAVLPQIRGSEK